MAHIIVAHFAHSHGLHASSSARNHHSKREIHQIFRYSEIQLFSLIVWQFKGNVESEEF